LANFKTHLSVGMTVSVVVSTSTLIFYKDIASLSIALNLFILTTIGSLAPDIDAENSIPLKYLFSIFSILSGFFFVFNAQYFYLDELLSVVAFNDNKIISRIIFFIFGWLVSHLVLLKLFKLFTRHRGIIHSIPYGIMLSMLIYFLSLYLGVVVFISFLFSAAFFIGFITHLLLDEIYAVNLSNLKTKKSFGTAFKVWDKNNPIGISVVYIIIFLASIKAFDPFL